jgi:hypothetical protein
MSPLRSLSSIMHAPLSARRLMCVAVVFCDATATTVTRLYLIKIN